MLTIVSLRWSFIKSLMVIPKRISSSELFNKKKVILVSVPGAFTPTCSNEHLPGHINNLEKFKEKGVDDIYFVSVNDPFVMDAWINSSSNGKINYVADSNSEFLNSSGLEMDLSVIGWEKAF